MNIPPPPRLVPSGSEDPREVAKITRIFAAGEFMLESKKLSLEARCNTSSHIRIKSKLLRIFPEYRAGGRKDLRDYTPKQIGILFRDKYQRYERGRPVSKSQRFNYPPEFNPMSSEYGRRPLPQHSSVLTSTSRLLYEIATGHVRP